MHGDIGEANGSNKFRDLGFGFQQIYRGVLCPQYHSHIPPIAHRVFTGWHSGYWLEPQLRPLRHHLVHLVQLHACLQAEWWFDECLTAAYGTHVCSPLGYLPDRSWVAKSWTECLSVSPTRGIRPVPFADGPDNSRREHPRNIVDLWVGWASIGARFERISFRTYARLQKNLHCELSGVIYPGNQIILERQ